MENPEQETGRVQGGPSRRTVLKTAGAGTVGAAMLTGRSAAQDSSKMQQSGDNENGDEQASTFLILFEHTVEGKEQIEGVPQAVEDAQPLLEDLDAEQQHLYFGSIGVYDGFGIVTFPNGENAEVFRLTLEQDGTHEFEVYEIWEAEEYFELIEEATSE